LIHFNSWSKFQTQSMVMMGAPRLCPKCGKTCETLFLRSSALDLLYCKFELEYGKMCTQSNILRYNRFDACVLYIKRLRRQRWSDGHRGSYISPLKLHLRPYSDRDIAAVVIDDRKYNDFNYLHVNVPPTNSKYTHSSLSFFWLHILEIYIEMRVFNKINYVRWWSMNDMKFTEVWTTLGSLKYERYYVH